jgi:hypothetical protein
VHSYSSGLTDRTKVIYFMALTAVALFFLLGLLSHAWNINIPFYISMPSSGVFFSALFGIYDQYLWRVHWHGFRFSSLVDLNGTYVGYIIIKNLRRPEEDERDPCWVRIRQSWSKISITFETTFSRSLSSMASIDDPAGAPSLSGLRYYFQVQPKQENTIEEMGVHSGLARLWPQRDDWTVMDGDWFNDFGFQRYGAYHLERLPSDMDVNSWLASVQTAKVDPGAR